MVVAAGVFFAGPRIDVSHRPRAVELPADLDAYLRQGEAAQPGLVAGAEKTIVWARPDRARTPLAIVYLHGFSATRQELAPLCDEVAAKLGANLHYARLTGHGQDGTALARATVNDWLNDAEEALRIGERLGERVLVVGCSTGGTLATWLAGRADNRAVLGYVLVSPNFAVANKSAAQLEWPWARVFVPRLWGETLKSKPRNEAHAKYWTTEYPTLALLPMAGVCQVVRDVELERIDRPLLMLYCPQDRVVDIAAAQAAFVRWGAKEKEAVAFTPTEGETHVIAGAIRAPSGTAPLAEAMVRFVERVR